MTAITISWSVPSGSSTSSSIVPSYSPLVTLQTESDFNVSSNNTNIDEFCTDIGEKKPQEISEFGNSTKG